MADVPQTLALITLAQQYAGDIVRQINRKATALRVIPIVVGEGKNVAWVPESSGSLAAEYAEGADAEDFGSDGQTDAILAWAQQRATSRITGLARAASRTTQTPRGNVSLVMRNVANSAAALASLLNQRVYSGNGAASPKQITGLNTAIGDDSNTYATINRASATYWRPTVIDPGSPTPISFAAIRSDLGRIYDVCGENPDVGLCSTGVFNAIGNLFDSNRRYVQVVNTARGEIKLAAGFEGLEVGGCIFLKDKDATEGTIYYLNTNYVELQVLPDSDEPIPGMEPGTVLQANDGYGALPLGFTYEKLAKTGDSTKYQAKVYAELAVKRPNACGVRKNVAVTA
jgi:hypothetical protein